MKKKKGSKKGFAKKTETPKAKKARLAKAKAKRLAKKGWAVSDAAKEFLRHDRAPVKAPWYQDVPTLPKVEAAIEDARGYLHVIGTAKQLNHPIGSVVVLYTGHKDPEDPSAKASERANHIHKEDAHLTFLLSGSMEYFERDPLDPDGQITRWMIEADTDHSTVFTPPGVEHCMRFSGVFDTVAIVLADKHRGQEEYEADITRVPSLAAEWDNVQTAKENAEAFGEILLEDTTGCG